MQANLKSSCLPRVAGCINGRWLVGSSSDLLTVTNPATGETLARIPAMAGAEAADAIRAAEGALDRPAPASERAGWLARIAGLIAGEREELARIITLEQGKPLKESLAEADYAAGFFRFYCKLLHELEPRRLSDRIRGAAWTVHQRPLGVAGLITPWNFPLAMLAKKVSAALGAGCASVIKPASLTPLSAVALCHLAEKAGVPPGWLNLFIGRSGPVSAALCGHPAVRMVSCTGSTETGRALMGACAPHLKRLALELGGNAPFLVFEDADLEAAAEALVLNKFRCAGQTCVCTNRVLVHESVEGKFAELLAQRVARLKVGNGLEPGVDLGPLINREGFLKVARHVRDAVDRGAKRIAGSEAAAPAADWGCFFPPTILAGITPEMSVFQEETFGPVIAIGKFRDEAEALALANGTPYGLAAYLFTRDAARASRLAARLRFGHLGVNTGTGPTPEAPFGGMKQSGFGREGGLEGLLEYCEPQTVAEA